MKETITEILTLAVNAPSGHNSQPWKFEVKDTSIFVYNIPEKDKTLFNWKQIGSFISHGALIENIAIIASEKGYGTSTNLFPKGNDSNLIAEIKLEKNTENYSYNYIFPYILNRATNRRPFEIAPFKNNDREVLVKFIESQKNAGYEIFLTEDKEKIGQVSGPFSMGDRMLFENFYVHKGLFDNVNWTLKEERENREGLYVGTKELNLFERTVFKYLLSNWNIIQKLNKIKFSEKAALKREKLYKKCSAMGLITAPGGSSKDFIESGRILERLWLLTTSLGLSFQPVSVGLLYIGQRCEAEEVEEMTLAQRQFVKEAYKKVKEVFNINNKVPTFSFRIGYAEAPTASSLKKEPEIKYLN